MTEPTAGPSRKRKRPAPQYPLPDEPSSASEQPEWYTKHLNSHILESRANLTGTSTSQPRSTIINTHNTWEEPIGPNSGIWSAVDKSTFFASLSRHSRLRPDLIALDTSKPESEVTHYLQTLELGAGAVRRRDAEGDGWRDRSRRWGKSHFWRTGDAGSAREVSEKWLEREESLAAGIEEMKVDKERFRKKAGKIAVREHLAGLGLRSDRAKEEKKLVQEELDKRWRVADYGEELDAERLGDINSALRPYWQEWYGDRVNGSKPTIPVKDEEAEGLVRGIVDKYDKIAMDDEKLREFEERGKADLSKDEKTAWRKIINRKRTRRKYRLEKLLQEGMTEGEIEEQGGVDELYAKKKGKRLPQNDIEARSDVDDNLSQAASTSTLRRGTTPASVRAANIHVQNRILSQIEAIPKTLRTAEEKSQLATLRKQQKTRTRYRKHKLLSSGLTIEEVEAGGGIDAVYLQRLGKKEAGSEEHSEIFDTVTMSVDTPGERSLRELGVDQYVLDKGWDVFNYAQLSILQSDPSQPNLSFSILSELYDELRAYLIPLLYRLITSIEAQQEQPPTNTQGWIRDIDVYQTLSFRGEEYPGNVLEEYIEQEGLGENMRRKYSIYVDPPGMLGWGQMSLVDPSQPEDRGEEGGDDSESDRGTTLTDEEDVEMDRMMDEVDMAYDEIAEEALWDEQEGGDWTCDLLWREVTEDKKRVITARQAYIQASRDIGKARRARHALRQRSFGFQGALKSAKWGSALGSREFVLSDSEEEGSARSDIELETEEGDDGEQDGSEDGIDIEGEDGEASEVE